MKNNKKMIIGILVASLLISVATFSYALWEKYFTQSGENTTTTLDCFNVTLSGGTDVTMPNAVPQTDEKGLTNKSYDVTITNKCASMVRYNVIFNKKKNSSLQNKNIKVAMDGDIIRLDKASTTEVKDTNYAESAYQIGTGVALQNKEKTIHIRSWLDNDTTPTEGQNKNLGYKITIEAVPTTEKATLKEHILALNTVKTNIPDFTKGFPTSSTTTSDKTNLSGLYITTDDDGGTYYFRGAVENNYVQFGTSKKNDYLYIIGKEETSQYTYVTREEAEYECERNYDTDFRIYETAQECKDDIFEELMQTSGSPIIWRIVRINGDGTIRLVTDNPIEGSIFNKDYQGYQYVGYTYDNSTNCTKSSPCKSTYNGRANFINSNGGKNSTIKSYLENWYHTTLGELDSKIAQTTYCNDTSYGSGDENDWLYYGIYKRQYTDRKPSLECPDPTKQDGTLRDYGGVYKLKIGLINADEIRYAGLPSSSGYTTRDNYLLSYGKDTNCYWWTWTMSPSYSYSSYAYEFTSSTEGYIGYTNANDTNTVVRPVINLKTGTLSTSGDGTSGSPFKIN